MKIGICDDCTKEIMSLRELLDKYSLEEQQKTEILIYNSGKALLKDVQCHFREMDILFLDVEMGDLDGLRVKEHLKNYSTVKKIVFLTSHPEAMPMAFGIKVIGFCEKPMDYLRLKTILDVVAQELREDSIMEYRTGNHMEYIHIAEIVYIFAEKDYSIIYKSDNSTTSLIRKTLKGWEDELFGKSFIRIHKSYLVNPAYIANVQRTVRLNVGQVELPLGRAYRETVQEKFLAYIKEKVRKRIV